MPGTTRRQFLRSAAVTAGMAGWALDMPPKRAMEWAQEQIARAIKGQLKVG